MKEVLNLMLPLAVAVTINISTGTYFKIGKQKITFNWKIFFNGVFKALIVGSAFIGVAYISKFSTLEYAPKAIMITAITCYGGKAINNLLKILGIDIKKILQGSNVQVNNDVTIQNPEVSE